jgi:hypothetical protein
MFHVDSKSKALLLSQGHNIDSLYEKYSKTNVSVEISSNNAKSGEESKNIASNGLDRFVICGNCNGQGVRQVIYNNYFVRDENCSECDQNGLIELNKGRLPGKKKDTREYDHDSLMDLNEMHSSGNERDGADYSYDELPPPPPL